jgi:hypothetical protein
MHDLKTALTCEGDKATVTLSVAFDTAIEAISFNERLASLCRLSADPNPRNNPLSVMARSLRTLPPSLDDGGLGRPINGRDS